MNIRCYSELALLPIFKERCHYFRLNSAVGEKTFGFDWYIDQVFYRSTRQKQIWDVVIAQDMGCDLEIIGREIHRRPFTHHMNPIRPEDIRERKGMTLNPGFLIITIHETHLAIHYDDENRLFEESTTRRPNGTCPWKKQKVQWYEIGQMIQENLKRNRTKSIVQTAKRQHQPKPYPREVLKRGLRVRVASCTLNPSAGYTGGCPLAAEKPTEPVFQRLERMCIYAGTY